MQHIYDERTNAPQFALHVPDDRRVPGGEGRPDAVRLHDDVADHRQPVVQHDHERRSARFVQDDWQVAPNVKVLYGVRYDLYNYPAGIAGRAARVRRTHFNIDKNNFGPRVGVAWSIDPKTVVRASTGIMYDQPILGGYEQALQLSGSPRAPAYTLQRHVGGRAGVPEHGAPAARWRCSRRGRSIRTFVVAHTWQSNVAARALARPRLHRVGGL